MSQFSPIEYKYLYVTERGMIEEDVYPPFWSPEMNGYYHRFESWRCVLRFVRPIRNGVPLFYPYQNNSYDITKQNHSVDWSIPKSGNTTLTPTISNVYGLGDVIVDSVVRVFYNGSSVNGNFYFNFNVDFTFMFQIIVELVAVGNNQIIGLKNPLTHKARAGNPGDTKTPYDNVLYTRSDGSTYLAAPASKNKIVMTLDDGRLSQIARSSSEVNIKIYRVDTDVSDRYLELKDIQFTVRFSAIGLNSSAEAQFSHWDEIRN